MMTTEQIRQEFPQLKEQVYGHQLVYLDNAATSLRPKAVIDTLLTTSTKCNANIHRAVHKMSVDATEAFENARTSVAQFINAPSPKNIIFTSGTTSSINMAAFCFGEKFIKEEDEIIIAESEHHSDIVPWQMLCSRKKATIKVLPVDESGHLKIQELPKLIIKGKTKIVCVAHASNVIGLENPIKEIIELSHANGVAVMVDGAQGIVHRKVDVKALGCDFYAFSGHKIYASSGTGVLYMADRYLEDLDPWQGGGEMIATVKWSGTTYAPAPGKFEAGTQNINAVPTLTPALKLAAQINGLQTFGEPAQINGQKSFEKKFAAEIQGQKSPRQLNSDEASIVGYMLQELPRIDGLRLYGEPRSIEEKLPLFSFSIKGVHHEDLALILDKMGIAVRSGQMCAEPLMDRYGVSGMLRASFAPYNTLEEAQYFIESLHKAIKMLI